MPDIPAYHRDPYRTELTVRVTAVPDEPGTVTLDDTVLYPGGGGQPADRGTLDDVPVLESAPVPDGYRVRLERPVDPGHSVLRLDWSRRFDHMQQHTGQHLLTAVAADRFGWPTTSFHLGSEVCDVELDTGAIGPDDLRALEEAVAAEIRRARPVTVRRVTLEAYDAMTVRSRGLPEGHAGDVRLVEIEGIDVTTCGGTHVNSTAEIESLALLGTESMRGGTRVHWVAGARVRERLGSWEERGRALRSALGVADHELVEATEARSGQLKDALRQLRHSQGMLAEATARELAGAPGPLVALHLEGWDPGAARAVAQGFVALGGDRVALLTSDGPAGSFFAVASGEGFGGDVAALGAAVADVLEGRGGGAGRIFQGRPGTLATLELARERLRAALGPSDP